MMLSPQYNFTTKYQVNQPTKKQKKNIYIYIYANYKDNQLFVQKMIMGLDIGPKMWAHERSERQQCGPQGDDREREKQWSPK